MKLLLAGLLPLTAFLVSSPASAASDKACATGGKMVEAFAILRDQQKPLADVDKYIDGLPGVAGDAQQGAFYKKLARAVYDQPNLSPTQARGSFVEFCSAPARP